ncbi:MAG TPA: hypothetical protein VN408_15020 [Actinoplanes sp.]|nr:hypothetical protein [Actinoplanes sp.]
MVVRWRGRILVGAVVLAVATVVAAVRGEQEPRGALAAVFGVSVAAMFGAFGVVIGRKWRGDSRFETDDERRVIRTPRYAAPVFLWLFVLGVWTAFASVGGWLWAHEGLDPGWLAVMLLMTVPLVFFGLPAWRGGGFELSADGIRVDRPAGRMMIPWTAVGPGPVEHTDQWVNLPITDPALVVRRGLVWRPQRLTFEIMKPEYAAEVVRHYVENPADRAAIGTGIDRFEVTLRPSGPPPSRSRIVVLAAGAVLFFAAGIGVQAIVENAVTEIIGTVIALIGAGLGVEAFRGARDRRLLAS